MKLAIESKNFVIYLKKFQQWLRPLVLPMKRKGIMSFKIITTDDDPLVRETLQRYLVNAGFVVEQASDGVEGIEVIKKNPDCHLIITDLNMPNMTGIEMLERLANDKMAVDVPKIMLTTEFITDKKHENIMDKKGKQLGVRAWFIKPVSEEKAPHFIGIVNALVEGKK